MKTLKFIYIGLAAALPSSCIQEVQPEGQHVSGMWAIVNEQSQTNKYIKFEDGYMTEYTASDFQTVAEGQIWHASAADFKGAKSQKYRLNPDGQLFLDGKSAGELVIDGDKMKYGKQDAVAVTGFSKDWYSAIVTGVSNNQINADLLAQEFTYDLSVINPIPNSSVKISVSPAGSASVTTLPDGKYKISLPEINSNSTATINFTYPGAAPAKVNVTRQASSSISVSKTEWSYEYYAQSVSIPFTLSNPSAGAAVTAELTSSASWLKDLRVEGSSVKFSIDDCNDPYTVSRQTGIKLSAKGCLDVVLNITQRYTTPVITYSPTSLATDYTAKTGQSFRYTITNTRDGGSTAVSCTATWISNLKDNNGAVTFDVAENNSGSIRSASITTRYIFGGYNITKSFAVSQGFSQGIYMDSVDLGLSVKWATCNVGASNPEDYGDYFAWAASEPWYESGYAQEDPQKHWKNEKTGGYVAMNAPYCVRYTGTLGSTRWTKYVGYNSTYVASGTTDDTKKTRLDPIDDAAFMCWGGSWRMPTSAEWRELVNTDNCSWTWTSVNGVRGYKVQSKKSGYTDNWIFLPACGSRGNTSIYDLGSVICYWSSDLDQQYPYNADKVDLYMGNIRLDQSARYTGHSVRPVSK